MTEKFRQYIEAKLDTIESRFLKRLEVATLIGVKEVLTVEEAVLYTGFSRDALYRFTCKKQIPFYKRGVKIFFNKKELDGWMMENRIKTEKEIDSEATTYTVLRDMKQRNRKNSTI